MLVSRTSPFGEKFRVNKVLRTSIVKLMDVFSGPEGCKFSLRYGGEMGPRAWLPRIKVIRW